MYTKSYQVTTRCSTICPIERANDLRAFHFSERISCTKGKFYVRNFQTFYSHSTRRAFSQLSVESNSSIPPVIQDFEQKKKPARYCCCSCIGPSWLIPALARLMQGQWRAPSLLFLPFVFGNRRNQVRCWGLCPLMRLLPSNRNPTLSTMKRRWRWGKHSYAKAIDASWGLPCIGSVAMLTLSPCLNTIESNVYS